jgi:hypothetical protein
MTDTGVQEARSYANDTGTGDQKVRRTDEYLILVHRRLEGQEQDELFNFLIE